MKKCIPLIVVLLLLFRLAAGQPSPTLQIVNTNGNVALSWAGGSASPFSLQTTTNLLPPITWTDLALVAGTGNTDMPIADPQQFFRLAQVLPIFQFAIFYNVDLEIDPGAAMTIQGAVWSNGGIWTGSTVLTLANTVSAVGIATNTASDPFCTNYTGTGKSTYSMAGQPTSGNDRITMPIGTNNDPAAVEAIINMPPAAYAMNTAAAFTTNGQIYLANAADLYLTNFPYGTNWGSLRPNCTNTNYFQSNACMILYYQDAVGAPPYWTQIPYDFYLLKTNYGTVAGWWTNYVVTNNFYGQPTSNHFNC